MRFFGDMTFVESIDNSDEVSDIIAKMQRQESTVYRRSDYLATSDFSQFVDGPWRQRIVEWMFGVVDHCSLRRDSVAIASYYLDLCVERGVVSDRQHFQLAAMTALQLAIKLYDSTVVRLDSMIKLGRGMFSQQDVLGMESKMLNALKWHVHPPTPTCFLRQFLRVLPREVAPVARYMIAEITRFISEISVCLYRFIDSPSSAVAYAGMLIAIERIDESILPFWQREEIFVAMTRVANMDRLDPEMIEITGLLKGSLEKNVSLQDLMTTIDAHCQVEGFNQSIGGTSPANCPSSPTSPTSPTNSRKHFKVHGLSSPRDVVSTRRRRV